MKTDCILLCQIVAILRVTSSGLLFIQMLHVTAVAYVDKRR